MSLVARSETLSIHLPDGREISLSNSRDAFQARLAPGAPASRGEVVAVGGRLAQDFAHATEMVAVGVGGFLQRGRTFFVIGAALPSTATRGGGYCGAGTEDFLLLVELVPRPKRLELRDRLRVQSCLDSMELESDQGAQLRIVLRDIADPAKFTLTWLQHPLYGPVSKTLTVVSGRFVISP